MKQIQNNTLEWFRCAGIRALKTFAQTFISMVVIGQAVSDVDWRKVLSVSIVASVISIMTSVAGLPEVDNGNN
jgi:hypothetical protein